MKILSSNSKLVKTLQEPCSKSLTNEQKENPTEEHFCCSSFCCLSCVILFNVCFVLQELLVMQHFTRGDLTAILTRPDFTVFWREAPQTKGCSLLYASHFELLDRWPSDRAFEHDDLLFLSEPDLRLKRKACRNWARIEWIKLSPHAHSRSIWCLLPMRNGLYHPRQVYCVAEHADKTSAPSTACPGGPNAVCDSSRCETQRFVTTVGIYADVSHCFFLEWNLFFFIASLCDILSFPESLPLRSVALRLLSSCYI